MSTRNMIWYATIYEYESSKILNTILIDFYRPPDVCKNSTYLNNIIYNNMILQGMIIDE